MPSIRGGAEYLARFADREGQEFVRRFYRKYRGLSAEQALDALLHNVRPTPQRLAVIFRSIAPEAGVEAFAEFSAPALAVVPASRQRSRESLRALRAAALRSSPTAAISRGSIRSSCGSSPICGAIPKRRLTQTIEASAAERQAVYAWLFKTHQKNAQDIRIRTLLEIEAFSEIHRHWKRVGYPFESLVPSYATAIGVSGDRPAALAELIGIIVNDGIRYPTVRMEDLHFAAATPYETSLQRMPAAGEQVMKPEVAATLKRALANVVEEVLHAGCADRFRFPTRPALVVGGKTGTGDNRFGVYGAGGKLLESRAVNRTATFAFFLGERHFGVVTAYVPGPLSDKYNFTSALPVQILKIMAADLRPYVHPASKAGCAQR